MYKQSSTDIPLSPEEQQEASHLFGRSLFSAIQLAKENALRRRMLSSIGDEEDDSVLKIPLPAHLMPQPKIAEDFEDPGLLSRALKIQNHPIQMLLGGQRGFGDAKKDFYMSEKARIQKDLMNAQKDYIELLGRIKTGSADESTPCVDAFCNGIAHEVMFEKVSSVAEDTQIEEGSIKRLLGDVAGLAKKPFQPAIDTAASGLLGTGAGAAYLTYMLRKKMREEPDSYMEDSSLPTRVELEPYA
jgi:hypothetical protein